jgi:hypothetical protein
MPRTTTPTCSAGCAATNGSTCISPPTSSSWLNPVERWFRKLTDKALRRGSFSSVPALIAAIEAYLDAHNDDPNPFKWTATVESIPPENVSRGRVALQTVNQ